MHFHILQSIDVSNVKVVRVAIAVKHLTLVSRNRHGVHREGVTFGVISEHLAGADERFLFQAKHRYVLLRGIGYYHVIIGSC